MRKALLTFLIYLLSCFVLYGQKFPVKAIIENGPTDQRINMVFLGDGYQITEMDKYDKDVQAAVKEIFEQSPYKEYKELFNVYAIEVPSNESGCDHPGTAADCPYPDSVFTRDTYFNTTFDYAGIHRLIVAQAYTKVTQVLLNNFPDYDMVMMVVNHNWYGGSGGDISVFSTNSQSAEIAIHEAGHSFAHLADEYDYGTPKPVMFEGINVTWRTHRDSISWNPWISADIPLPTPVETQYLSKVGLFEGAYYSSTGMYRPKYNCKMRTLNNPFCEVCREAHVKAIFSYLYLIDEHYPVEENVTINAEDTTNFSINPLELQSVNINVTWLLDGNIIAEDTNNITLDGSALSTGGHSLSVVAEHITDFVINDPEKFLQSSFNWIINVSPPTGVEKEDGLPQKFALLQNYPNPFNPVTRIKYIIPAGIKETVATLKVYDVIGREISTLVNEIKAPGIYEVSFDGNNLPSGVYFYRLQSGNYSEVKKFVLMK